MSHKWWSINPTSWLEDVPIYTIWECHTFLEVFRLMYLQAASGFWSVVMQYENHHFTSDESLTAFPEQLPWFSSLKINDGPGSVKSGVARVHGDLWVKENAVNHVLNSHNGSSKKNVLCKQLTTGNQYHSCRERYVHFATHWNHLVLTRDTSEVHVLGNNLNAQQTTRGWPWCFLCFFVFF